MSRGVEQLVGRQDVLMRAISRGTGWSRQGRRSDPRAASAGACKTAPPGAKREPCGSRTSSRNVDVAADARSAAGVSGRRRGSRPRRSHLGGWVGCRRGWSPGARAEQLSDDDEIGTAAHGRTAELVEIDPSTATGGLHRAGAVQPAARACSALSAPGLSGTGCVWVAVSILMSFAAGLAASRSERWS